MLLILLLLVPVDGYGQCSEVGCCRGNDRYGNCWTSGCSCYEGCVEIGNCCDDFQSVCLGDTDGGVKEIFIGTPTNVSSPNYPSNSPHNYQQSWIFSTHTGLRLLLSFVYINTQQNLDFVAVGNGIIPGQQQLLQWSGGPVHNKPKTVSSHNTMWMSFSTDGYVTYQGFLAVIEAFNSSLRSFSCEDEDFSCTDDVCIPTESLCNGETNCYNGTDEYSGGCASHNIESVFVRTPVHFNYSSLNYTDDYQDNYQRSWIFSTYEGLQVLLNLDPFGTHYSDYFIVGDGNITGQQRLLKWTGNLGSNPLKVVSSKNSIWMTLYTRSITSITSDRDFGVVETFNKSERSFSCGYDFDCTNGVCLPTVAVCNMDKNCYNGADEVQSDFCRQYGGADEIFVDTTINISSLNYPSNYPDSHYQSWIFSTYKGFQLLLSFEFIDTESAFDYVSVGNGKTPGMDRVLFWSGGPVYNQLKVLSSDNSLRLTFTTDRSVIDQGFFAVVEAFNSSQRILQCGRSLNCTYGVCLPIEAVCKGEKNCYHGVNGTIDSSCSSCLRCPGDFKCVNGVCLPPETVCSGETECYVDAEIYQETECAHYDHPDYGCQGQCMYTTNCPGSKYVPGLCPSQPEGVECCFTANTDTDCATHDHSFAGEVGHCISTCQCTDSYYVNDLCANRDADVKCCFKKPTGTCSQTRQELACAIKKHHDHKKARLLDDNFRLKSVGRNDGASALDNIVDTCNGGEAKRSSFSCNEGTAPGGSVYLSTSILQYILGLLDDGYHLKINALAGGCHRADSRHYQGTAVDLQIGYGDPYTKWMERCRSLCAIENEGPGRGHHSIHTHCAFSN